MFMFNKRGEVTFRRGLHKVKEANSCISEWRTQATEHFDFRYFRGTVSLKRKTSFYAGKVKSFKRRKKCCTVENRKRMKGTYLLL